MATKKRVDRSTTSDEPPPNNPFGALAGLRGALPERPTSPPPDDDAEPAVSSKPAAARVRRERKGRGGKTVTIIEGATISDSSLRSLKRELGLGARREGDAVVVQGDAVDRVRDWLDQHTPQHAL